MDEQESDPRAPEADVDVVAHDQTITSDANGAVLPYTPPPGMEGLASSLDRLAERDSGRIGMPVVLQVASAWARENNARFSIVSRHNEDLTAQLSKAQAENAAHRAKDKERSKHAPLVGLVLMFGPISISMGISQFLSDHIAIGTVLFLFGLALLGTAFWSRRGEAS